MSARLLIAAGRGPARVPACEQTLQCVRTKVYHLVRTSDSGWFMADKLRSELKFDGWQKDHDANTRRLHGAGLRTARVDDFSPLLMRALSLFGPGELRALRVLDIDVFRLVTSLTQKASSSGGGQAIGALCAIQIGLGGCFSSSPDTGLLATLLERHSSTVTELDAKFPEKMAEEVSSALARCTRLEILTGACAHDSAVWLGLSQLHTLRGVHLDHISVTDIAAALPKLHTLEAFGLCTTAEAAVFVTDLLPRLRVFQFEGDWWGVQPSRVAVAPLPLLEELVWIITDQPENIVPCEFFGAQPTLLHASYASISRCWLAVDEATSFLARVSDLRIAAPADADPLDPADVARVLRAAPQLKKFRTAHSVRGDASWLAPTAPTHPAFEGLVHPRLREFCAEAEDETSQDAEWIEHLRQRHFPRLRELDVGAGACWVTTRQCW
jgi:hypothetical protein